MKHKAAEDWCVFPGTGVTPDFGHTTPLGPTVGSCHMEETRGAVRVLACEYLLYAGALSTPARNLLQLLYTTVLVRPNFSSRCGVDCGADAHQHVARCAAKPPGAPVYYPGSRQDFERAQVIQTSLRTVPRTNSVGLVCVSFGRTHSRLRGRSGQSNFAPRSSSRRVPAFDGPSGLAPIGGHLPLA
jgi:hypothetical protein